MSQEKYYVFVLILGHIGLFYTTAPNNSAII